MLIDYKYTLFTTLLLGILGALVFFIWGMINSSFSYSYASNAAIKAGLVFAVLGLLLGLLVGNRK